MNINEFLEKFAELFDDTDPSEINADTEFRDLDEWSSMMRLAVMAMIDDEYDVQLQATEMRQAETVEELFEIVKSKK